MNNNSSCVVIAGLIAIIGLAVIGLMVFDGDNGSEKYIDTWEVDSVEIMYSDGATSSENKDITSVTITGAENGLFYGYLSFSDSDETTQISGSLEDGRIAFQDIVESTGCVYINEGKFWSDEIIQMNVVICDEDDYTMAAKKMWLVRNGASTPSESDLNVVNVEGMTYDIDGNSVSQFVEGIIAYDYEGTTKVVKQYGSCLLLENVRDTITYNIAAVLYYTDAETGESKGNYCSVSLWNDIPACVFCLFGNIKLDTSVNGIDMHETGMENMAGVNLSFTNYETSRMDKKTASVLDTYWSFSEIFWMMGNGKSDTTYVDGDVEIAYQNGPCISGTIHCDDREYPFFGSIITKSDGWMHINIQTFDVSGDESYYNSTMILTISPDLKSMELFQYQGLENYSFNATAERVAQKGYGSS